MISLGKILILPKGNYDANAQYNRLNIVSHNGCVWICKESCQGIEPTEANTQFWMKMFGFNVINRLDYKAEGGVLDARQGTALKQLIVEKEVYELVTVLSDSDGKIEIPNKDDYEVFSAMCTTSGCTVVGNTHNLYARDFRLGDIGDIMPNTSITLAVTYVRK